MWRACRQMKHVKHSQLLDVTAINCLTWCKVDVNLHRFFECYSKMSFDSYGWPQILKLTFEKLEQCLPRHNAEYINCLPFKAYTHPYGGYLNLAAKLPMNSFLPDMGPKSHFALGLQQELGHGEWRLCHEASL